jgi:hypothetical protein
MNTQMPSDPEERYKQEARDYRPGLEVDKSYVSAQAQNAAKNLPPEQAYKNVSSNFYWVAGLSMINSLINTFGGGVQFPVGLAVSQFVDGIAIGIGSEFGEVKTIASIIGLVVNAGFCGLFVLLGYLGSKGSYWPMVLGIAFYSMDALLMLLFQDWIGFGFHAFILLQIFTAFNVIRLWRKSNPNEQDSFPRNIGVP